MLKIEDLRFSYKDSPVLDGVSLDVRQGEIIAIVGPNGCGKTTLLKHLNRNLQPDEGKVYVGDTDLEDMTKMGIARNIASVPQTNEIRFSFMARDIVAMGRMPFMNTFSGESSDDIRIINEAMEKTNITKYADRYINTMSGGERQRVIIARALAQTPKIILLDEPTLHLDICAQFDVLDLVKKLAKENDLTVIVVSHDLPMVVRYCDRIVMLKDHRIFAMGTPEEILTPENMRAVFDIDAVLEFDGKVNQNTIHLFGSCSNDHEQ